MSEGIYNKYTGYHNRKSIRLKGYDYSRPGYYFITICIHDRNQWLFGDVVHGEMVLNEMGNIAYNQFACLPERFPNMKMDVYQIMPNHIHAIIQIVTVHTVDAPVGATLAVAHDDAVVHDTAVNITTGQKTGQNGAEASHAPTVNAGLNGGNNQNKTIGDIIGAYKSLVSNECLNMCKSKSIHMGKLWQRNYWDHIIRDEKSLFYIRKYIRENPQKWSYDSNNHLSIEEEEMQGYFCSKGE